jgi:hypothetical protein
LGRPKKARPPVRGGGTHQTRHDPYLNPIPGPSSAMQAASAQVPPAAAAAGSAPPVRGGGTHQTRHDPYLNPIPGPSWAMQAASAQVPPAAAAAGSAPNQDSGSRRVAVLSQNTVQVSQSPWSPDDDLTDMFADVGDENVDVGNWN